MHRIRFKKILEQMAAQEVNGLLLNSEANVSYAAGFKAPDSYCLATRKEIIVITDFRYASDFERNAALPVKIIETKNSVFKTVSDVVLKAGVKKLGFESRHLSFAECEILNDLLGKKIKFIPLKNTLESVRAIKDKNEIENIKKALAITLKTFDHIKNKIKPGISELQVAAEIEHYIRMQGAHTSAFDTIVASGPNSSYPHARLTNRIMRKGDMVIVDMGVDYDGYKSDLTRTFFLGKINPIVKKAANIVRTAQKKAIEAIRPKIPIKDIDAAARNYIAQEGFGENFGHALGHGVGLEVHESPSINKKNHDLVKAGMIFTIEPGIYVPGKFGIRMEEMILVTDNAAEIL